MLIDKQTKIKIVKEHLNDGITLKELKERNVNVNINFTKNALVKFTNFG